MRCLICVLIPAAAASAQSLAQSFDQRGYVETSLSGFPQTAPNDSSEAVGEAVVQWDLSYKAYTWLKVSGGVEAQTDTHHETERTLHLDLLDRGLLRPAFEIRTAKVTMHRGHFTADIGKQLIRWGKADLLNPTDRFAPRDYLDVVDSEVLGVLAARATVEAADNSLDLVWMPWFTPSRIPLLNQRWAELPPGFAGSVENAATHFPGGGQYGARVNHIGRHYEASASIFEGYNHLPLIGVTLNPSGVLYVERFYPKIRMYGADSAIPLPWFTIKIEAGYFQSRAGAAPSSAVVTTPQSDDYILYVAQIERQMGDWMFVAGYVGQTILTQRSQLDFDPERGLAQSFLSRVAYTIDSRQSVSLETATRQNGQGSLTRPEYSRLIGSHWRATLGAVIIEGASSDFLGQYHRNSSAILKIRYSF
jgi:hypothetical protein